MLCRFFVPLEPMPYSRVRTNGRHFYNDSRYSEYKETVGVCARNAMRGKQTTKKPISISIIFSRNKKTCSKGFGDLDNLTKAILDSLNGICYEDDIQVCEIHARKMQFSLQGTEIEIREIVAELDDEVPF